MDSQRNQQITVSSLEWKYYKQQFPRANDSRISIMYDTKPYKLRKHSKQYITFLISSLINMPLQYPSSVPKGARYILNR